MSVTTQANVSALLKQLYLPVLENTIFQDTGLLDLIPLYKGEVRGSDVRHAVELTRTHGGGARGAGEFLPVDYHESFQQSIVTLKRWYYTISIDGFAVENIAGQEGSFVDYLTKRMQSAQRDASNQLNRICHMDGTGVIGVVGANATASTQVTLKHVWPNGFGQETTTTGAPTGGVSYTHGATQFLEEDDSIGFAPVTYTNGVPSISGPVKVARVVSMDWANQTVTLDSAITVAANEVVFFADNHSNSFQKEASGLRNLIQGSAGKTVQGISTDYRRWRSTVVDKTAAPVPYDWTHVTRVASAAMYHGGSEPQDIYIMCHPAMLEEHQRLVDPDLRYAPTDFKLNKGLNTPIFQVLGKSIPVKTTTACGFHELICLNASELERLQLAPISWDTRGGELKNIQGKDALYGYLKYYYNIAARSLNHLARFDGIQVDTEYVKMIHETA